MKRKEGEILHQCGKWWCDGMIFNSEISLKVLVATFILVWSPGPFWGHTLCVACQLPISKGGGESKVPNRSYPKFHFQKLPFEDCTIFSLFPTEHFRCHDMILFSLHAASEKPAKNVMLKYVDGFLLSMKRDKYFDLKQTTCSLYFGGIRGKLTFHHFNLMVLIDLMSLGGFVHRHRSLLLSSSKKHKQAPCNGFPLVFCSSNIRGHFDQSAWQILQDAMGWMKRLGAEMLTFYFKLRPFKLGKSSTSAWNLLMSVWLRAFMALVANCWSLVTSEAQALPPASHSDEHPVLGSTFPS